MQPHLGAGEIDVPVMSLVHFVRVVELAEMFCLAVFVVSCRMCVEIAHAEVWTAACLNCGSVDRPVRTRRRGMTCADAKQCDHKNKSHSVHRISPFVRKYAPVRIGDARGTSEAGRTGPPANLSRPAAPLPQPLASPQSTGGGPLFHGERFSPQRHSR